MAGRASRPARPQTGLMSADLVYVIPVEGGLSRLLAVFSSHVPAVIGPVRSAREDDLELLGQFGRPAFAYSGAQPQLLPVVERARVVDLYDGRGARLLPRPGPGRAAQPVRAQLAAARPGPGASKARGIGFRFDPAPAGGRPVAAFSVSYPAASFTFRWSAGDGCWLVWMDGRPAGAAEGGQLSAPTVVIQYTKIRTSRFLEAGTRPPYAESTGTGTGRPVMTVGAVCADLHNCSVGACLPAEKDARPAAQEAWARIGGRIALRDQRL